MNANKALWEKGDFTEIAGYMRESGEAVVQSLGVTPPLRVLDLGCGDGTTAVPLARMGGEVVGIDIARNLVDAGNKRAAEAGLSHLQFQEGDKHPEHVVESFRRFYGTTMNAFEAAEKNGKEKELHDQLLELANAQNKSGNGGTFIPARFLRVTVWRLRTPEMKR